METDIGKIIAQIREEAGPHRGVEDWQRSHITLTTNDILALCAAAERAERLEKAIVAVRQHHAEQNSLKGRAIERSHTIALCDAALNPSPSGGGE